MRDNIVKLVARRFFFRTGSVHKIQFGPLRGMRFRISPITGLSPWYSGAERFHQRFFRKVVRPGDVGIDVGANWGLHTLYLSQLVGCRGLVIAAEPNPSVFAELEWHAWANHRSNVRTYPVAISDAEGQALFRCDSGPSQGCLLDDGLPAASRSGDFSVPTRTLDSIVKELNVKRLKLVKIDVEGAEERVLRGATHILRCFMPYLIVDLHVSRERRQSMLEVLASFGYEVTAYPGKRWGILACPHHAEKPARLRPLRGSS